MSFVTCDRCHHAVVVVVRERGCGMICPNCVDQIAYGRLTLVKIRSRARQTESRKRMRAIRAKQKEKP